MKKKILSFPKNFEEVKGVIKLGGYNYWDWKFPFRHFKKEEVRIFTNGGIWSVK
jgi:hypothetical protein